MAPQVGLQLYSLREALAQDFAGTLRQVAPIGYAGVETAFFSENITPREAAGDMLDAVKQSYRYRTENGLAQGRVWPGRTRCAESSTLPVRTNADMEALMAASLPIQLNLPADLYARIQEAAARSDQPIESVLVESLALLFGTSPIDWDDLATTLETLPDAQLWALAYRRVTWIAGGRLRELTARGKQAPLSDEEQAELAMLVDEADRMMLLRSRALLVLQQRGHNVRDQLQLGA